MRQGKYARHFRFVPPPMLRLFDSKGTEGTLIFIDRPTITTLKIFSKKESSNGEEDDCGGRNAQLTSIEILPPSNETPAGSRTFTPERRIE
jgi:hypothetical protein